MRVVPVLAACLLSAVGPAAPSASASGTHGPAIGSIARSAAAYFLARYERADGRVDRIDQGGDTVSEGQAYAMLVAVATGNRARFDAAWSWARAHLLQGSGLMAWHWRSGAVVTHDPATDADVDAAWALALAAERFGDQGDAAAARSMAAAVLGDEAVTTDGSPVLVAGPWAAQPSPIVNPSYDAPPAFSALAALTGGASWQAVGAAASAQVTQLLGDAALPSDWAIVTTLGPGSSGVAHPTSPPGDAGGAVVYGFDAVRLPVLLATACTPGMRARAAGLWGTLQRQVGDGGPLVGLDLGGSPVKGHASTNPIGLVGAAGAAWAAGLHRKATALMATAWRRDRQRPTYYASAWVALGALLLGTSSLGGCGPGT